MAEDQADALTGEQRKVTNVTAPGGISNVYVNNIAVGATAFDFRLVLGQIMDANPEEIVVMQHTIVVMTWLQSKILAAVIQQAVDQFEKINGPITLPNVGKLAVKVPPMPPSKPPDKPAESEEK